MQYPILQVQRPIGFSIIDNTFQCRCVDKYRRFRTWDDKLNVRNAELCNDGWHEQRQTWQRQDTEFSDDM